MRVHIVVRVNINGTSDIIGVFRSEDTAYDLADRMNTCRDAGDPIYMIKGFLVN